jgi:hypothetical protein
MSLLQEIVRKWIVDVYHQRPQCTLKIPPAIAWKSSIKTEDIQLTVDMVQIDAILGRTEQL